MSISYVREKFSLAIGAMATSPSSIQQRVADAYMYHLIHLKADELPVEIQEQFKHVRKKLTSGTPVSDEGTVMATIKNMSSENAMEIAEEIVYMESEVRFYSTNSI